MCDGTYQYPTKGGTAQALDKPIIIICGNAPIEAVYPKAHRFIKARFIEICIDPKETLPVTVFRPPPKSRDIELKDIKDQETLQANKENHDYLNWRKRDFKRVNKTPILMLSQEASSSEQDELDQIKDNVFNSEDERQLFKED